MAEEMTNSGVDEPSLGPSEYGLESSVGEEL